MTPADLPGVLASIGWSRRELARRMGITEGAVRCWVRVPPDIANWLLRIVKAVESR